MGTEPYPRTGRSGSCPPILVPQFFYTSPTIRPLVPPKVISVGGSKRNRIGRIEAIDAEI